MKRLTVYLDVAIDGHKTGRIVIELYKGHRFYDLCKDGSYEGTYFHRVIKNFICQGGNTSIKSAGYSKQVQHDLLQYQPGIEPVDPLSDFTKPFQVCMAGQGDQFFITTEHAKHLNGKHTILGRVIRGKSVVRSIEKTEVYSNKTKDPDAWVPKLPVVVESCGEWSPCDPVPVFDCCNDQIGKDYYEEYPDDNDLDGLNLDDADAAYRVTSVVKQSAGLLYKERRYQDSYYKYLKAMRYCNELIPDENKYPLVYGKFLDLKKAIYLNLSLCALTMKQYNQCIKYCVNLLAFLDDNQSVQTTPVQLSKVYYRLGKCYSASHKYADSIDALKRAQQLNSDDKAINIELDRTAKAKRQSEASQRQKLNAFFS